MRKWEVSVWLRRQASVKAMSVVGGGHEESWRVKSGVLYLLILSIACHLEIMRREIEWQMQVRFEERWEGDEMRKDTHQNHLLGDI